MSRVRVAIIGCGGIAKFHARGYSAHADCEIVAVADINSDKFAGFIEKFPGPRTYTDYRQMITAEKPDLVSVCLWPRLHAPVTIEVAGLGVKHIHCEKPMAATWGEARRMVEACDVHGVRLTIGHQRRYGPAFIKAKELLDGGAIGQLVRMEGYSYNLYDWGIHWFDMMFFYNDDQPADWVMGQIDARGGRTVFGMPVEGQGLCYMHWRNGVYGLLVTGKNIMQPTPFGADDRRTVCNNRLLGTDGMIEVGIEGGGPGVCLLNAQTGGQWQTVAQDGIDAPETIANAMRSVLDGVLTGAPVKVDAHNTLRGTEAMFAAYESSRRRQRIDLPLTIDDNPLESMLANGMVAIETPPPPPQGQTYKL